MGNSSFIRILCRFESKEETENDTEDIFFFGGSDVCFLLLTFFGESLVKQCGWLSGTFIVKRPRAVGDPAPSSVWPGWLTLNVITGTGGWPITLQVSFMGSLPDEPVQKRGSRMMAE